MLDHKKVHVISLWQENICTCLKQARIGCTLFAARERYDASLQRSSLATVAGLNNDGSSPGVSTLREGLLEHCHVHEISSLHQQQIDLGGCKYLKIITMPTFAGGDLDNDERAAFIATEYVANLHMHF